MIGLWGPKKLMNASQAVDKDFANIFLKPIATYLANPETAEVMVNGPNDVWVEDNLGLRKVPEFFTPDALQSAVNSLAQYVGRPLTENVFSIDARMPDGSRICIMLPPVSGESPVFSIRVFKSVVSDLGYLVSRQALTDEMVTLIDSFVKIKKNMMVSGGTSSGKTTLLNLITSCIPDNDRIITIEDSKELQLKQAHVLPLEARPADKYGKGEFTIRQCLKSSLRLRPDRIVVGEIRGGEAFDLIQAMNTGHGGCMGTVHANTPVDTLRRIESLCLMADVEMPLVALRSIIASAIDVVVAPARLSDGSRKVIQISEIGPLTEKGDYQTFDIVKYVSVSKDPVTGKIRGFFHFTGQVPHFFPMFAAEGIDVPIEFFRRRVTGSYDPSIEGAVQAYMNGESEKRIQAPVSFVEQKTDLQANPAPAAEIDLREKFTISNDIPMAPSPELLARALKTQPEEEELEESFTPEPESELQEHLPDLQAEPLPEKKQTPAASLLNRVMNFETKEDVAEEAAQIEADLSKMTVHSPELAPEALAELPEPESPLLGFVEEEPDQFVLQNASEELHFDEEPSLMAVEQSIPTHYIPEPVSAAVPEVEPESFVPEPPVVGARPNLLDRLRKIAGNASANVRPANPWAEEPSSVVAAPTQAAPMAPLPQPVFEEAIANLPTPEPRTSFKREPAPVLAQLEQQEAEVSEEAAPKVNKQSAVISEILRRMKESRG